MRFVGGLYVKKKGFRISGESLKSGYKGLEEQSQCIFHPGVRFFRSVPDVVRER